MKHRGLSDQIRDRAVELYVQPARKSGKQGFSIAVKPLMTDMESNGFPKNHPAQFCTSIRKESFLSANNLEIERVDGPPSGTSTTVVVHYRFKQPPSPKENQGETPAERAERVTNLLAGRLRSVIKEFGGTEGYMAWVRREGE